MAEADDNAAWLGQTLADIRLLRSAGRAGEAQDAVAAALASWPADDGGRGWLLLEQAGLAQEKADIAAAVQSAVAAQACFDALGEAAGGAAAQLALGDAAWAIGNRAAAQSHWANARSLADSCGAGPLGARALIGLAIADLGGDEAVSEARLQGAEARASVVPPQAADGDAAQGWQAQADAVRAGLAVWRARQAVAERRWPEARLLLDAAAQAAAQAADLPLYAECLRVDAALSRRCCDPDAAVAALKRAVRTAQQARHAPLLWLCRAELALALIDNGALAEAAALVPAAVPGEISALPAVAAAVLESFAAIALAGGQPAQAEPALLQAVDLRRQAGDTGGELRAMVALGQCLMRLGAGGEARKVAQAAGQLADRAGSRAGQSAAALLRVQLLGEAATLRDAEEAVQWAVAGGGVADQLAAIDAACALRLACGDAAGAALAAAQAVALAAEQPLLKLRARAACRHAQALWQGSQFTAALAALQDATALAEAAGDDRARSMAALVGGAAMAQRGAVDEAAMAYSRAVGAAERCHRADLAAEAWLAFGQLQANQRQFANADTAFARAEATAGSIALAAVQVRAWRGRAWCARESGDFAQADGWLQRALAAARAAQLPRAAGQCAVDAAEIALAAGDLAAAERALAAPELADTDLALQGQALAAAGQIAARRGQWPNADALLGRATALLRTAGEPRSLGAALYLAGQVAGMAGNGARAGQLLADALAVTAAAGLPEAAQVRATIERIGGAAPPATTT